MSTLRHNLGNLISTPMTMVKLSLMKLIYPKSIFFTGLQRFSPSVVVDTDRKSSIRFGHHVSMYSRCKISAHSGGNIRIGSHTAFNMGCIIISRSNITVGQNVAFGPNVLVYDHDHVMDQSNGPQNNNFYLGDIEIGDNTWIGAGSIILRGTYIGNNCVIAAGSVVKGHIPDNTRLIQKRTNIYKRT